MADREQVVPVLLQLPISNLDAEWVKSIWESEFTEIPELEGGVSEDLQDTARLVGTLSDLQTTLHGWTDDQEQAGTICLWTVLVENDISLKNLIALLTYLIDAGSKHSSLFAQKQLALFAACSYLKLIVVPGSSAFKVFHPQLYENSVDLLKQLNKQAHHAAPSKRKRSSLSSQHSQSRKNKSMKRGRNAEPLFEDDDDNDDVEEELSPHQVLGFSKLLKCLLKDVVKLLDVFSLRQSETSSHKTVQILSQLSRIEGEKFNGSFDLDRYVERLSVTGLAYRGLILLCQPLHGNVIAILNAVCKTLLPGLLMLVGENKVAAQTIPNSLSSVRDHAVKFVCYLMEKCGERAHPSVRTLLQHMCTKVPDRTEYRAKVSEAVVTILQCLPAEPYGKMVEWFYRLSRNSKMNNRGFALDVVTLLLQGKKKSDLANLPAELAPYLEHRYLVSMIVARCSDSAPTVRARAISCFCQCLASKDTLIVDTLRDIVTPRQRAGRHPNAPRLIHTPVNSGQTSDADTGIVTEPSITPADQTVVGPPPDPEGAIQTPATNNGPPGAEQTPFLSVNLTPGFNPNLVDDDGVISMLRRRAQDEKVNVRKSALQAIESFIRFEGASYRKEDIEVLKERCRDPSLTVRKQAMQSLTDLLLDMSHDEHLQRMWLDGVLPLVIDRETSLQEKCFETLEGIVLNNIVPFQKSQGSQYELVWGLLGIMAKYECVDLRLLETQTLPPPRSASTTPSPALSSCPTSGTYLLNTWDVCTGYSVGPQRMLEKHRSPVLKDLMFYLQELMRDYKTEVKEILSTDRQLANEIEFDLRKFEEQQMEAEKQSNTIQQATPGPSSAAGSPRPPSIQGSPSGRPKADDLIGKSPVKDAGHSGSQKTGSPFSSPKSVRQTSPMTSPGQATSPSSNDSFSRDSSLTTLAILNSAKKAFERNQQLKSVPNSPLAKLRRRQSVAIENARKNSLLSDPEDSSPSETEKESEASRVKTPKRVINRKMTRAISTPSNALSNITFHMDQNVTLVPPSPIPTSLPIRVYGDMSDDTGEPSTPSKKQNKENGNKEKQVVFMFSPDKPLPKPRQWKVKTPAQVQTKMQVLSETDSESSISVFTDHDNSASSSSKPKSRLTNSATSESSTSIAKSRPVRRASRSRKT
ncbi:hypothetical protein ScPMuIL_015249 [Solemya velum]